MANPHREDRSSHEEAARRAGEKTAEQTTRIGQAAAEQTTRIGQAAAEAGQEVARAGADLLQQNAETLQNAWRLGLDTATAVMGLEILAIRNNESGRAATFCSRSAQP